MTLPKRIAYLKRAKWLGSWGERELSIAEAEATRLKYTPVVTPSPIHTLTAPERLELMFNPKITP